MKRTNTAAPAVTTSGRAWYAVGVLLLAYIFSIMDRQILTLLVGPIQQTLGANDTSMGLLHGFTFAAFYAVMGLPIARMIDRGDRPMIIAVGIAVWSVATAASGLATDFVHLVAARTCVAVGEAVLIPGAVSLLANLFSPDKRGRAMGIFGTGAPVGAGVGLLAGGLLLGLFTLSPAMLPFLGELLPWQATFIAVGLPGVVIAVLMLFVPEPRRKGVARTSPIEGLPVSVIVGFLRSHRKTFTAIMFGAGFLYLAIYGWLAWTPTYFVRELGWTYPQVGKLLGIILTVAGPLGALGGSWIADFWRRKGVAHASLRVGVVSCVGMAVASTGMVFGGSPVVSVISLTLGAMFSFTLIGVGAMSLQETAPAPMLGQVAALFAGVLNIIGAGLGPVAVGVITDYVLRDPSAIGTAIFVTCVSASVIGLLVFRSGFATYAATRADATDWRVSAPTPAIPTVTAGRTSVAAAH
jgi:MFS family permease